MLSLPKAHRFKYADAIQTALHCKAGCALCSPTSLWKMKSPGEAKSSQVAESAGIDLWPAGAKVYIFSLEPDPVMAGTCAAELPQDKKYSGLRAYTR